MGIAVGYEIKSHGLFPDVVGQVILRIKQMNEKIKPIDWTIRGALKKVFLYVRSTPGKMFDDYKELIKGEFEELFREKLPSKVELIIHDEENPIDKPQKSKA